jgi:hypothetical protein
LAADAFDDLRFQIVHRGRQRRIRFFERRDPVRQVLLELPGLLRDRAPDLDADQHHRRDEDRIRERQRRSPGAARQEFVQQIHQRREQVREQHRQDEHEQRRADLVDEPHQEQYERGRPGVARGLPVNA